MAEFTRAEASVHYVIEAGDVVHIANELGVSAGEMASVMGSYDVALAFVVESPLDGAVRP